MYADRYAPRRLNRGSLGLSIGLVAPILAAALLASPAVQHIIKDPGLETYIVPATPPPPRPEPVTPQQQRSTPQTVPTVKQIVATPITSDNRLATVPDVTPTIDLGGAIGPDVIPTPEPTRVALPVLVGPAVDPRYANALQPGYPPAEQRAGHDGVVTLRVLIGVDGRVKQAEQLSATSDAFWRVTQRQALTRWRFRPATRDGIPTEGWRTMTVRFNLADAG